ncbi:hypothetical protein YC2023_052092 [Brassica napus]
MGIVFSKIQDNLKWAKKKWLKPSYDWSWWVCCAGNPTFIMRHLTGEFEKKYEREIGRECNSSGPSMIEQDNDKHNKISEHSGQAMPLEQDEKVVIRVSKLSRSRHDGSPRGRKATCFLASGNDVIRVSKLSRSRHDGSPIGRQLVCNKERLHAA